MVVVMVILVIMEDEEVMIVKVVVVDEEKQKVVDVQLVSIIGRKGMFKGLFWKLYDTST